MLALWCRDVGLLARRPTLVGCRQISTRISPYVVPEEPLRPAHRSDGTGLTTPARSCVGERPIAAEPTGFGTSERLASSTPNLHTVPLRAHRAGVATAQSSAGGQSDLAPRTAHDLLVDLQKARPTPLSGTVVQTMDLGLPDLSA